MDSLRHQFLQSFICNHLFHVIISHDSHPSFLLRHQHVQSSIFSFTLSSQLLVVLSSYMFYGIQEFILLRLQTFILPTCVNSYLIGNQDFIMLCIQNVHHSYLPISSIISYGNQNFHPFQYSYLSSILPPYFKYHLI